MERITNLISQLEDYQNNLNAYFEAATINAEDTIIDMNIEQLYSMGERRDGREITPYYAPATVAIKKKKGQRTDHVTLRDTFDWQASFFVQYYPDGFEIKASDWKTERLKRKYGDEILGLQDGMVEYLCKNFYLPHLITELKKILGYV